MRALVIDDSRTTRRILARILTQVGFDELHEAGDGQDAIEVLERIGPVDLALVDWNMPVMNGYELVRAVRARPEWSSVCLLMVTTESGIEEVSAALDAGANEYLMKPFNAGDLKGKLALLGIE